MHNPRGMVNVSLFLYLVLSTLVSAHGYVSQVTIDGKSHKGNPPQENSEPTFDSGIRRVASTGPVKPATNTDLGCGLNAQPAVLNLDAMAGSNMTFKWVTDTQADWIHDVGPILTYMASCRAAPCSKFDSTNAKWFKIDEIGKQESGSWSQELLQRRAVANVTLPATLAPGNYLIRHEIIALHNATSREGAEFYPSCTQLIVNGNGTGAPSQDELVSLPGAYKINDPGILIDVYTNPSAPYYFPGPPVAAFVNQGSPTSLRPYISGTATGISAGTESSAVNSSSSTISTPTSSSASSVTASASGPSSSSSSPPKSCQCKSEKRLLDTEGGVALQRGPRIVSLE